MTMTIENAPLTGVTLDAVRVACGYPNFDAIRQCWYGLFGAPENTATPFPGKHERLPYEVAEALLKRLSRPYANRPESVIQGALRLLEVVQGNAPAFVPANTTPGTSAPLEASHGPTRRKARRRAKPNEPAIIVQQPAPVIAPAKEPEPNALTTVGKWICDNVVYLWHMPLLEKAYYVGIFITMYGLIYFLDLLGYGVAAVYFLISRKAMLMAKSAETKESAKIGLSFVVVMELAAWFVHFAMYNISLWNRADKLPWQFTKSVKTAAGLVQVNTTPGTVAFTLASFMSLACAYAVWQMLSITTEKYETEYWKSRGL